MKGLFISFEGIEGSGKSTQAKMLCEYLGKKGFKVILTEEPGGTKIGVKIREILLSVEHKEMDPITELILYNASRAQHIKEVIVPSIKLGAIVITDRFSDSTYAYQGYGRGIDFKLIESLDTISTQGLKPDITILLDLPLEEGLNRNRRINKKDRLELEDMGFHEKVKTGFMEIASRNPDRIKVINSSLTRKETSGKIITVIEENLWRLDMS